MSPTVISSLPVIHLEGEIQSNAQGVEKIIQFYNAASNFHGQKIRVDCTGLRWMDANLTALLSALDYRLLKNNRVEIVADFDYLLDNFPFLFQNKWLQHKTKIVHDVEESALPCTSFSPVQLTEFLDYIKEKLMTHKGTFCLSGQLRAQIENDLVEIFTNIQRHAKTNDPLFVCGHCFKNTGVFVFTMADLGVGFLQPIQEFTKGKITTCKDALVWALNGNSTSNELLAGMGLSGIHEYCRKHNGGLQIVTGNAFWGTALPCKGESGHLPLKNPFEGSIINLFFPLNNQN